jgi:transposase
LQSGDVLVLDNARIHNCSENKALAEWLWMRFDIFVAWLPTRSPELNPIKLIWSYLVRKLQTYPLTILRMNMRARGCSSDVAAYAAKEILDGVSHDLVWRCVKHCYKDVMLE